MSWLDEPLERAACHLGTLAQMDAAFTLTLKTTADVLAEAWRQARARGTGPRRHQKVCDAILQVSPTLAPETFPALVAVYNGQYLQHLDADGPTVIAEWLEIERLREREIAALRSIEGGG